MILSKKPLVEISKISSWQKVSEVLGLVLEKPKNERLDYLKEICGEDKEIFAEVESLLAFDTSNFPSQSPLLLKSSGKDKSIGNYNLIKEMDTAEWA
ncbi:MAG: hypothetical protein HC846_03565 [Blastocatellia bacterium]|nr:hypothetical protein [Blastocatellia bacterium]